MTVIFLDVDGVLNAHDFDDGAGCFPLRPDNVNCLKRVLQATGAVLVLSSMWRHIVHRGEATLEGMDWLLRSHGLPAGRLVGVTPPDATVVVGAGPLHNERGNQIAAWLSANGPVRAYAVVDDSDQGISAAGHPLVRTDGQRGLTERDADQLIALLGRRRRSPPRCRARPRNQNNLL